MLELLKFTTKDDEVIYLNKNHISMLKKSTNNGTNITLLSGMEVFVKDTLDSVSKLISS